MPSPACEHVRQNRPPWSVSYRVLESRPPTAEEKARGVKRVILRWLILEVSPVQNPAGAAVGTLEARCG